MEDMMTVSDVTKERLQQLGRRAASIYRAGTETMSDAVVSVLDKEAGLSAEHVKRVIEFANNDAYRDEYDSMDGQHRIVNLEGGPASPGVVLRELEMTDSAPDLVKSASRAESIRPFIPGEEELENFFDREKTAHEDRPLPQSRPNGELIDLRFQLQAARSDLMTKLSSVEGIYDDASDNMYKLVKQAVLNGTSPAVVSRVYQRVSPSPSFTKLALKYIANRMEPEGIPAVVSTKEMIKKASESTLNTHNPIVTSFLDFVKVAEERFSLLNGIGEIDFNLDRVNKALFKAMK